MCYEKTSWWIVIRDIYCVERILSSSLKNVALTVLATRLSGKQESKAHQTVFLKRRRPHTVNQQQSPTVIEYKENGPVYRRYNTAFWIKTVEEYKPRVMGEINTVNIKSFIAEIY